MQTGRIEVVPFDESHIETAATLAVERYRLEREQVPELAARHEDKDDILPLLRDLTARNPGVAAFEDGELRGFMVGMSIPNFKGRHRGIYCPEWGHAAAGNQRRRVYQHMYEHISGIWVKNGCYTHAITIFAHDTEALDLWFRSCFGLRVVDALRDLSPVETQFPVRVPDGLEIRKATVDDVDAILRLTEEHQRYMARAPIFVPLVRFKSRADREKWLREEGHALLLALCRGEAVAYMQCEPEGHGTARAVSDPKTVAITGAYTMQDFRRAGIATALLKELVSSARSSGYERCSVDFESQNIYGSRFWTRHFRPVCYSVLCHVDDRIAWAHSERPLTPPPGTPRPARTCP